MVRKSSLIAIIISLFPICNLLGGAFSYYDEIMGIVSLIFVFWQCLKKRLNKASKDIIIFLSIVTLIGVISNLRSGFVKNIFPIAVDILWLWKTIACYIMFQKICSNSEIRNNLIKALIIPAKLGIVLTFVTALIAQVIDIGVSGNKGYIRHIVFAEYGFFWNNAIQTGWLIFVCILILAASAISTKTYIRYWIMASVPLLLTFSSLNYCWYFIFFMMIWILRENAVFKYRYIIILVFGMLFFASADFVAYFIADSPRLKLIIYGIQTARNYFPIGAGFATYGSEMALRYYSDLYIQYGWENTWLLGRESNYLNDNFFAGIIGQFGFIGFGLYLFVLHRIFRTINTKNLTKRERVSSIATVITIFVVMIASASAKSMMGVCIFSVLGIVSGKLFNTNNNIKG